MVLVDFKDSSLYASFSKCLVVCSVSIIDDKGMRTLEFKKHGDCTNDTKLSYLDRQKGILYFVPRGCYLEIINKNKKKNL